MSAMISRKTAVQRHGTAGLGVLALLLALTGCTPSSPQSCGNSPARRATSPRRRPHAVRARRPQPPSDGGSVGFRDASRRDTDETGSAADRATG